MNTIFLRVLEAEDKATALLDAVREPERARGRQRFEVDPRSFASVPRSPFAYWVSDRVRGLFKELLAFEAEGRFALGGLKTLSDERFVRGWWEVPAESRESWPPLAKGGAFSRIYADVYLCVNWRTKGEEISWYGYQRRPREGFGATSRGIDAYFRPGLTWPRRTNGLSVRAMPAGCIFADKGPAAFVENDNINDLLAFLCITNSRAFGRLVSLQLARTELAQSYEVGLIQTTPIPSLTDSDRESLARLARSAWSLKRSLDTRTETSHAFALPALLAVDGSDINNRAVAWSENVRSVEADLAAIQAEIDERCFALYEIDETDRRAITESFDRKASEADVSSDADDADDDVCEERERDDSAAGAASLAAELVSWAIGVAFGRFDMSLATGARPMPSEPEPFDPLPACSPSMFTGGDGLRLARRLAEDPLALLKAGVLVDDLGHAQDLPTAVRAVFDVVFGAAADRWWNDVATLLDPKSHDLRIWLGGSFFEHHLKRHSKSRRKAPIVWQLGTPSGRYSVWLYAHRLTRDSFFQLQNDVVGPKVTHEERQLTGLTQNAGASPSAPARKEMAAQEAFVEELRAMLDEVKRIAPLWNPTLNDGVVVTMAPLWRLVTQHKPWQKELKTQFDGLAAGKYDWAHLAMHLWPKRVIPKCATDRSLAIAHGLEDVFWVDGTDGKRQQRPIPTRSVDELVRERTSPSVKAALKSLLDAPVGASNGRGRGRRSGTAAATGGNA